MKEQLTSLVDQVLPQPIKPSSGEGEGQDEEMNGDWDMYSDEDLDEPIASGSGRTHVVFTEDLDTGNASPLYSLIQKKKNFYLNIRFRSLRLVRSADPKTLLQKRSTPTSVPTTSNSSSLAATRKALKGKQRASLSDSIMLEQERELQALEIASQASEYRTQLTDELHAREARLLQLRRAMRELEMQKIMMSSGARKEVVKSKGDRGKEKEEWWLGGGKPGKGGARKGAEGEEKAGLPNAEEGVTTGARVWVSRHSSLNLH